MRVWKIASAGVAALGMAALAVAWAPALSGQQAGTFKSDDGQEHKIVVRQQGPGMTMPGLAPMGAGGRLGVSIRDVTADDVAKLKLPGQSGVVIDDVEKDTPAAKGGVLKGDVAVMFDGEAVRGAQQFTRLVRETPPGRTVKMAVVRDGKRVELGVTPDKAEDLAVRVWVDDKGVRTEIEREVEKMRPELDEMRQQLHRELEIVPREWTARPGRPRRMPMGPMGHFQWFGGGEGPDVFALAAGRGRLGVTVQDLSPDLAEFFAVKDGVLVSSVQKDTPAAKAGIKAGDVITALDGKSVGSSGELIDQLREKDGEVSVTVMREKKALTLKATLEKKEEPKPRVMLQRLPA